MVRGSFLSPRLALALSPYSHKQLPILSNCVYNIQGSWFYASICLLIYWTGGCLKEAKHLILKNELYNPTKIISHSDGRPKINGQAQC